jgi:septal ring factor EnvC (AmiA/AmiB activator)
MTHGDGYYTIYSHLSTLLKNVGNNIKRGAIIAKSGDSGSLYGPCLYFEIRHKGRSIDPLEWFEPALYSELNAMNKTK